MSLEACVGTRMYDVGPSRLEGEWDLCPPLYLPQAAGAAHPPSPPPTHTPRHQYHHTTQMPVQRLHRRHETDPEQFKLIFSIIEEEVARSDHEHSQSCTKGLLWLNR